MNDRLDESGRAVDAWLRQQPMPPTMAALANLEVLLQTRRNMLMELVAVDDELAQHLLQMRTGQK